MSGRLLVVLIVACAVAVAVGLIVHVHGHFDWEMWPAAYGIVALLSVLLLALVARPVAAMLRRGEDYYDDVD